MRYFCFIQIFIVILFSFSNDLLSQVNIVKVAYDDSKWQLFVNNEPYYIKGAGGHEYLDELVKAGGNTIRTWSTEGADKILDEAHSLGLKVMLGLWVQHERHGFDYNNTSKVKSQLERFKKAVNKYKNHPALLMWGIGNEYELNYSNKKVWKAVNDIAKMIHKEDPNHPTSTVTAGTNSEKLKFVMQELKDIDIYGINTYADIVNVSKVLKDGEFEGPYMITEWGPTGHWEVKKTMWGSSVEQNSSEKALSYLKRYESSIKKYENQCIGSFAFLWGQKQEYTSTWYGLFTEEGMPTEALDILEYCWTGNYPNNRAPTIDSIIFNGNSKLHNLIVAPGSKYTVKVNATDYNNDPLKYKWELYHESNDLKTGGDKENKPPLINGRIKKLNSNEIVFKTPANEGRYRLFVFVDDKYKVAYLNIPFYVDGNLDMSKKIHFKRKSLE